MGLKDFAKGVGGAATNVVKGAAYVANPMNADDIAKGTIKGAQFVAEHPGVVKDIGVGILKEELKPQNLAINAALIAATVATGGAAAPAALAARGAMAARTARTGVTVARGVEAGVEATKAVQTGTRAARAGKALKEGIAAGRAGVKAAETAGTASKVAKETSTLTKVLNPIETSVTGPLRNRAAQTVLDKTGSQTLARVTQGASSAARPTRLVGQSDKAYQTQQAAWQVNRAVKWGKRGMAAPNAVNAAADPQGYAMKKAMESDRLNPKFGDTGEYQTGPGGQALTTGRDANGLNVTANGVVTPATRGFDNIGRGIAASNGIGGANAFWKGPTREGIGGIDASYDWRNYEQRNVEQVVRRRQGAFDEGGGIKPLAQPVGGGEQPPAAAPAMANQPVKPPTLPPQKQMAMSALYQPSKGTESVTTPGVRVMPKAGSGANRGPQEDRKSQFYASGSVYGEDANTTITGNAWNNSAQGSFLPNNSPNVGNSAAAVKPMAPLQQNTPTEPLKPLTWPTQNRGVKPAKQLTGVG